MGKRPSWRTKAMYLVFAVALVVGLMPLAVAPAMAQPAPTLSPCWPEPVANAWGATVRVTSDGMGAWTFQGWALQSTPPGYAAITNSGSAAGEQWVEVTPTVSWGNGETTIYLSYDGTNVTCVQQWHEDCEIVLEKCDRSTEVIWDEESKSFSSGPEVIWLYDEDCYDIPLNGAIVHWFMMTYPTDCVNITDGDQNATAPVNDVSIGEVLDPNDVDCNQMDVAEAAAAALGVDLDDNVWYMQSTTDYNDPIQFVDPEEECDGGFGTSFGTSWIEVTAGCEGVTRVVAVVEYPSEFSGECYKIATEQVNWWTRQREKVPQVRWAGEKIVLEKTFGSGYPSYPVCFSLENQSVGALERITQALIPTNFPQSSDTVWTTTDLNGTAKVIVISEDPGQVDVDLALYQNYASPGLPPAVPLDVGELINEHGFVVYYLKLESIDMTEVLGEREGHYDGYWDNPNPWDPDPAYEGTATGAGDSEITRAITAADPAWTDDEVAGMYVCITSGAGRGLVRKIESNDADTLTLYRCWAPTDFDEMPAAGSTFQIGGDLYPNPSLDDEPPTVRDEMTTEVLNVSQDALLRVRVEGFFENANPSMNPGYPMNSDIGVGYVDADRTQSQTPYDYRLPDGRWILPKDWQYLAGIDWMVDRLYWDIMDNPFDDVTSDEDSNADYDEALGDFVTSGPNPYDPTDPTNDVVAEFPVIGPFNTLDNYLPWVNERVPTSLDYQAGPDWRKTIVRNSVLDSWDTPMPPAKVTYEIQEGPGFFHDTNKGDIYYMPSGSGVEYTAPFYAIEVPASIELPPFLNNGEYDWDSWGLQTGVVQGPYFFWTIFNRVDQGNGMMPKRVDVFTDNHGEAMVWFNPMSDQQDLLDTTETLILTTEGALDVPVGMRIGNTTITAYVDYPYLTGKHPKLQSNDVEKEIIWGKHILGMDNNNFQYVADPLGLGTDPDQYPYDTEMVFQVDTPDPSGLSDTKMAFLWVSDADGLPAIGEDVVWYLENKGAWFADEVNASWPDQPISPSLEVCVEDGFLAGTDGEVIIDEFDALSYQVAISTLRAPTSYECELFARFQNPALGGEWPECLECEDYAVAAVVIREQAQDESYSLTVEIDEGPIVGIIDRHVILDFAEPAPMAVSTYRGDANMDELVNMGDVTAVERIVLGLAPACQNADANKSGSVDMGDVTKIERIILGR